MITEIKRVLEGKGCDFTVSLSKGLYLDGTLVVHSDMSDVAKELGITNSELHTKVLYRAFNHKIIEQKKLTANQIFENIAEVVHDLYRAKAKASYKNVGAPGKPKDWRTDTKLASKSSSWLPDSIIEACESLNIEMGASLNGSFLLPRSNEAERLTRNDVRDLFGVIDNSDPTKLMSRTLQKLKLYVV